MHMETAATALGECVLAAEHQLGGSLVKELDADRSYLQPLPYPKHTLLFPPTRGNYE